MMTSNDAKHELCQLLWTIGDGSFLPQDIDRLEQLTDENPELRSLTTEFAAMLSMLHWARRCPQTSNIKRDTEAVSTPQLSSIPGFLSTAYHGTIGIFSQELPFSLLIATLLTGFGLWCASMVYVSRPEKIAKDSSQPVKSDSDPTMEIVGKITGMVDCKWADLQTETFNGANVLLGRKYALASGLMEITYDTGAKVILQGPVTYEVESKNGGFLPYGRLTGKVESDAAKGFAVRTPTATVTDLGTEFGVNVDREGNNEVEVLQGSVKLQWPTAGGGSQREMQLGVGRSVRVDAAKKTVIDRAANPTRFVRSLTYAASQIISVNFTHGSKSDCNLDLTDRTGALDAMNWNNVNGSPNPAPTVELHDAAGNPTGVKLTWQWSSPITAPTGYNEDQMLDSRGRLFRGYFGGGTNVASLKIVVSNVPYTRYRVYVYYWLAPSPDPAHLHTFGLSLNGGKPTIIGRSRVPLYHFSRYRDETACGNYQVFDGLSGDLSVVATPAGPGKYHNLFIAGLQIAETPGGQ